MKLKDIETCVEELESLKDFATKESYNITSNVNKRLVKVIPILKAEKERLESEDVTITAPKIKIVRLEDSEELSEDVNLDLDNLVYLLNKELEELTQNDKKVIDYGFLNASQAYIKYNS